MSRLSRRPRRTARARRVERQLAREARRDYWLICGCLLIAAACLALLLEGCTVHLRVQRLEVKDFRGNVAVIASHNWVHHEVKTLNSGATTFTKKIEIRQERGW